MQKENIYNVPNFLSFYRLLTFPLILWFIYTEEANLFAIFLCVNLVTDILDGLIARSFNLQTNFGAKLDSLADNGTFIAAFLGIFMFKLQEMSQSIWMLWVFIGFFFLGLLVSFLKFKQYPTLHLYTTKIGGYVQGFFIFVLFAWSYNETLFYIAMILGYISHVEELIILLISNEMKTDAKGLYWVLWK
ncbi:CDP-diacylglycerol--glycerol-3-phosphate 3-phosphatidyltransferase [Kordia periserrulae]|uniref:CDP-diacylglycerol--glycerol-3-phosphate 3-phosphatidyltransferase n=1 Tax=Kordia periserrulae TaxID=701523 RepID=A0A2T6C5L3_9FLAO|nr:CDP-alcohol phosphatidyltransferase family protein [Kordia periserrulae]PTX63582.1 CDP-diacylglycerol--glycerol-3-phosphate 3-phosphatidyltransferase [Kordia periserrulae]